MKPIYKGEMIIAMVCHRVAMPHIKLEYAGAMQRGITLWENTR